MVSFGNIWTRTIKKTLSRFQGLLERRSLNENNANMVGMEMVVDRTSEGNNRSCVSTGHVISETNNNGAVSIYRENNQLAKLSQ